MKRTSDEIRHYHLFFVFSLRNYNRPIAYHMMSHASEDALYSDVPLLQSNFETLQETCQNKINFEFHHVLSPEHETDKLRNKLPVLKDAIIIDTIEDIVYILEKELESNTYDILPSPNFRKYIDKYATIKSSHIDALSVHGMPNTFQECREYFTMDKNHDTGEFQEININGTPLIDTPTMGGLWLIHAPETVYEACHGDMNLIGESEFWKNIYELTKNNPDFDDRNERYQFSLRQPDIEERMQNLIKAYEEEHTQSEVSEPEFLSPEWMQYQYQQTREITYRTEPDDIENWEGLIAPNGDFYSVEFGGHNQKAYFILIMHADLFQQTPEYFINHPNIRTDNALDTLLEYGWCATRSIMFDHYILPPSRKGLTTAQYNRIFDAGTKHDVKIDYDEVAKYL